MLHRLHQPRRWVRCPPAERYLSQRQHHTRHVRDILRSQCHGHAHNNFSRSARFLGHFAGIYGGFPSIFERNLPFFHRYVSSFVQPHLRTADTEILPESYGGHYGPVFNEYIESQNAKAIPGAHNISLETVLIGNGWYNPLIQVSSLETCS